jgi:hypothetical protein
MRFSVPQEIFDVYLFLRQRARATTNVEPSRSPVSQVRILSRMHCTAKQALQNSPKETSRVCSERIKKSALFFEKLQARLGRAQGGAVFAKE